MSQASRVLVGVPPGSTVAAPQNALPPLSGLPRKHRAVTTHVGLDRGQLCADTQEDPTSLRHLRTAGPLCEQNTGADIGVTRTLTHTARVHRRPLFLEGSLRQPRCPPWPWEELLPRLCGDTREEAHSRGARAQLGGRTARADPYPETGQKDDVQPGATEFSRFVTHTHLCSTQKPWMPGPRKTKTSGICVTGPFRDASGPCSGGCSHVPAARWPHGLPNTERRSSARPSARPCPACHIASGCNSRRAVRKHPEEEKGTGEGSGGAAADGTRGQGAGQPRRSKGPRAFPPGARARPQSRARSPRGPRRGGLCRGASRPTARPAHRHQLSRDLEKPISALP